MKTLAALLAAFLAVSPATGSTISLGSSLAYSCFQAAQYQRAGRDSLATCDRALGEEALDQRNRSATLVNRGVLHLLERRFADAGRDFDQAIRINPAEPEAWLNKAFLSAQLDQNTAVLAFADRALSLRTRRPALAYFVRAIALEEAGNVKAAYADLIRARDLAPDWDLPGIELRRYKVR